MSNNTENNKFRDILASEPEEIRVALENISDLPLKITIPDKEDFLKTEYDD